MAILLSGAQCNQGFAQNDFCLGKPDISMSTTEQQIPVFSTEWQLILSLKERLTIPVCSWNGVSLCVRDAHADGI